MRSVLILGAVLVTFIFLPLESSNAAQPHPYIIQPGDTWDALALRYGISAADLQALLPSMNRGRQPTIGQPVSLPPELDQRSGRLVRPGNEGIWQTALRYGAAPWAIASLNGLDSPYLPGLYRPLLIPGDGLILDLPPGIETLELSAVPAEPGQALGIRGTTTEGAGPISAALDNLPVIFATNENQFSGVVGTGAFYPGGEPELMIQVGDNPAWVQPWAFADRVWEYQELTLTGTAAEIDQQARDEERARLRELWSVTAPNPQWDAEFMTPVTDYLDVSANYGARRSYNGGPYLTYHEGVDFSAYAGTPVFAPAAGTVVLAEPLYVRGGAVIIDHGMGVFSGYYHLSKIHTMTGSRVEPGDLLGEVGTTGLSTGNHLHWDMLINGIWVDAAAWQATGLGCWLLAGVGQSCPVPPASE